MATLNDDDRENLAAFLDGELDEQTAQGLEAKLNQDPDARQEVDALRRAWSMLDILPRPEPSSSFTNRTMERLTLAVPRAAPTAKMPPLRTGRWRVALAWTGAVLLGLTLGAVAGILLFQTRAADDPLADVLAQNAGVVRHFLLYEPIIDLEFLKGLDQPDLFGELAPVDDLERGRSVKQTPGREGEPPAEPAPSNRQLRSYAAAFLALPPERREQLIRLDRDLESSNIRDRLHGVGHRYRDWFDHLESRDQDKVLNETDRNGRLAVVKEMRDLQWLAGQPRAHRELYESLQGQARADFLKKIHEEELQHQRSWRPLRKEQLPEEIYEYYDQYLKYMLGPEEKERLAKAEGQWPRFMQAFVELADRHPPALRGPHGPKNYSELPAKVKDLLNLKKAAKKDVLKVNEVWPVFAVAVSELAAKKKGVIFPNELWARDPTCLKPPMTAFVGELGNVLTADELHRLKKAAGKWPDYPETIQELANAHKMQPPWFTLPGRRETWDIYRVQKSDDGPR